MKKTILNSLTVCTLFFATALNAQVGVGVPAENIHPSAELEVKSNTKGFLPPRMTKVERDAIVRPAAGLLIYQTDGDANNTTIGNNAFNGTTNLQTINIPSSVTSIGNNDAFNGTTNLESITIPGSTTNTTLSSGPGLYYYDGTSWKNVIGAQGATGAKGIQGVPGADGSKGADGQGGITIAGSGINVTGTGTVADPYIVSSNVSSKIYTIGFWPELGGYVFRISADGRHGLVAETKDQSTSSTWYDAQDVISNPVNHSTNGQKFMDWRLPTKYELNEMYLQKEAIGGYAVYPYWSSTDFGAGLAWLQNFDDGSSYFNAQNHSFYVRAVRAF